MQNFKMFSAKDLKTYCLPSLRFQHYDEIYSKYSILAITKCGFEAICSVRFYIFTQYS